MKAKTQMGLFYSKQVIDSRSKKVANKISQQPKEKIEFFYVLPPTEYGRFLKG